MPLTLPPAVIEQAVEGSVTTFTRRIALYESDNSTLWQSEIPFVASGNVAIDLGNSQRRNCSLTMLNEDGQIDIDRLNGLWYDKVVRVFMGVKTAGTSWERSIGTFLIDRINSKNLDHLVGITMRDFSKKLSYEIPYALEWPANHPIEEIVRDLAAGGGVGPSQVNLPLTGVSTTGIHTINSGKERWKAIVDLATAHGYDVYFDELGVMQMDVFVDPSATAAEYAFRVGEYSNIEEINRNIADDLIRNHIVVTGEEPDGTPVWGEAENNNATSPTRIAKLGRRTRHYESSWVTSSVQCVEVAERLLKVQSLERFETSLTTVIVPWLDVNVVADFDDPFAAVGDPTKYLLNRVTIPLDLSGAQARLARVTSVL